MDAVLRVIEDGLVGGDLQVIEELVREDYIQHNARAEDGRAGFIAFIEQSQSAGPMAAEIHRILADDDQVALHVSYGIDDPTTATDERAVAFDVFRLEGGQLAEHWDSLVPAVTAAESVSGRSNTDGPTTISNREDTEANRELAREFVDRVFTQGQYDLLGDYIADPYAQHNPQAGDGIDGLTDFVAAATAMGIAIGYTRTPLIVADGNFVLAGSEGYLGPVDARPFQVFYDLWRVEGGKLVEHWDIIPQMPPSLADIPHDNGFF